MSSTMKEDTVTTAIASVPLTPDEIVNTTVIGKLTRDVRSAAKVLSDTEARYLVDTYYMMQDQRIRAYAQERALGDSGEPNLIVGWLGDQSKLLESRVKSCLHAYAKSSDHGQWMLSIHGIGPVIAAGLLAHIDWAGSNNCSRIWRFAGLDPTMDWGRGQKRPWNAKLKVLCYKIGDSFRKQSTNGKCFYGHLYRERKEIEVRRNEAGEFADQAAETLASKNFRDGTETRKRYEEGKLPDGRIDARARRWAVKMFLSHAFQVGYEIHHGERPAKPYVIEHMGHSDFTPPPNWPLEDAA